MAARRKGPKDPGGPGDVAAATRAHTVALEQIGSQFKVFGESLAMHREETKAGFARVDQELAIHGQRMDRMESRMDSGFARVDQQLARVDQELGLVKVAVLENTRDIKGLKGDVLGIKGDVRELKTAVARLDAKLDKKVDREEVAAIVEQIVAR